MIQLESILIVNATVLTFGKVASGNIKVVPVDPFLNRKQKVPAHSKVPEHSFTHANSSVARLYNGCESPNWNDAMTGRRRCICFRSLVKFKVARSYHQSTVRQSDASDETYLTENEALLQACRM